MGGEHRSPAALPREREPVPIVWEGGWSPGPVWMGPENLADTGIRSPDHPARSYPVPLYIYMYIYIYIWGWAVNTLHRPLYPQEIAPLSNVEKARWASRPVSTGMERRKSSVPIGVRTPNRPAYRNFESQCGAEDFYVSTLVQTGLTHFRYGAAFLEVKW